MKRTTWMSCLVLLGVSFVTSSLAQASEPPPAPAPNQLTLYFYPAPTRLDWSSPRSLTWKTVENTLFSSSYPEKHTIGHASMDLKCGDQEVETGMEEASDKEERQVVLNDAAGLGVLFHTFQGYLQTPQEAQKDIEARIPDGKVSWIKFNVSPATCGRMMEYYTEFYQRGYWQHYGLDLRPRYGEGGGCSSFAASFLDVAGLLAPEFVNSWAWTLQVPRNLVNGDETGRVSIFKMLFGHKAAHWGTPGSPHTHPLFFWDPETMYYWATSRWDQLAQNPEAGIEIEKVGKSKGLIYDRTSVPTPTGPIWLQD